jgi:hypothetical protein
MTMNPPRQREGVRDGGVQDPVPVIEVRPVRHPGKPHPDALDVRLEGLVPVKTTLLLHGGSVGFRSQGDLLLRGEGDEGELGFSRDGIDGAGVHRKGHDGECDQGQGDAAQRSVVHLLSTS